MFFVFQETMSLSWLIFMLTGKCACEVARPGLSYSSPCLVGTPLYPAKVSLCDKWPFITGRPYFRVAIIWQVKSKHSDNTSIQFKIKLFLACQKNCRSYIPMMLQWPTINGKSLLLLSFLVNIPKDICNFDFTVHQGGLFQPPCVHFTEVKISKRAMNSLLASRLRRCPFVRV